MSKKELHNKHCVPCEGDAPAFSKEQSLDYIQKVNEWQLVEEKAIEKIILFRDFKQAIAFVDKVAEIAESEGHHPDIFIFGYNKVKLVISTHAIGGLSENDFILASKIDRILV